jgi:hypothetical protein
MIEIDDVIIDKDFFEVRSRFAARAVPLEIREFVHAVTDEIEKVAKATAPVGDTGRLKAFGIKKSFDTLHIPGTGGRAGESVTEFPAFGGGFTVRGAGGRFTRVEQYQPPGTVFTGSPSRHSFQGVVELNTEEVPYAKWVHEGTGIYGPYHTPIVPLQSKYLAFWWHGRHWLKKSVRGQRAQPFLTEAYEFVNSVFVPAKIRELSAEIRAEL